MHDRPLHDHDYARAELSRAWPVTPSVAQYEYLTELVCSLPAVWPRRSQLGMLALAGSHGYGLAHSESDIDVRGFFVMPTRELLALKYEVDRDPRPSQLKDAEADVTLDEVGRFLLHAREARPNVFEVLWAPQIHSTATSQLILDNRDAFLSQRIRDSYGGFAGSQKRKAVEGVAGTSRPAKRAKHVRHMFRLMYQGLQLLQTGTMDYRLPQQEVERIRELEALDDQALEREFALLDRQLANAASNLPPAPDTSRIDELLLQIRLADLGR
jgi:predicted nucleotidyltransferase